MSIHKLHARLTQPDSPSALFSALDQPTFTGDPAVLGRSNPPTSPADSIWTGGPTSA